MTTLKPTSPLAKESTLDYKKELQAASSSGSDLPIKIQSRKTTIRISKKKQSHRSMPLPLSSHALQPIQAQPIPAPVARTADIEIQEIEARLLRLHIAASIALPHEIPEMLQAICETIDQLDKELSSNSKILSYLPSFITTLVKYYDPSMEREKREYLEKTLYNAYCVYNTLKRAGRFDVMLSSDAREALIKCADIVQNFSTPRMHAIFSEIMRAILKNQKKMINEPSPDKHKPLSEYLDKAHVPQQVLSKTAQELYTRIVHINDLETLTRTISYNKKLKSDPEIIPLMKEAMRKIAEDAQKSRDSMSPRSPHKSIFGFQR